MLTRNLRSRMSKWGMTHAETERDIFEHLGLEYVEPEARNESDYDAWLQK